MTYPASSLTNTCSLLTENITDKMLQSIFSHEREVRQISVNPQTSSQLMLDASCIRLVGPSSLGSLLTISPSIQYSSVDISKKARSWNVRIDAYRKMVGLNEETAVQAAHAMCVAQWSPSMPAGRKAGRTRNTLSRRETIR